MSASDLKGAILRQPSLLQHNIEATLNSKAGTQDFFDELSIPKENISRIIYIAPAIMGPCLNKIFDQKFHS